MGCRQQGSPEDYRPRARHRRGADPPVGQDPARRGAEQREGEQGRRSRALRPRRRGVSVLPGQLPRRRRRDRAALPARRHPVLQAGPSGGGGQRVPGRRSLEAAGQVPQGRPAAGDDGVREAAQAGGGRQARDHRVRPQVRRGGRSVRAPVSERQGDRHRHLQERPVLLRLRRLRRGGQTLRPDRREVPRRSQRRRGRRSHPGGTVQGQGLREHRDLGATPEEDAGVRRQGRAGPPGPHDRGGGR